MKNLNKISGVLTVLVLVPLLSGCNLEVLNPAGYVAKQERNLMLIATGIMLCIVIPVMIAVVVFAIRYRASNKSEEYLPDWGHSNKIEAIMWGIPICVVTFLAVLMWNPLRTIEPSRRLPEAVAGKQEPLQVDVVALEWKWLFIYPEYGVASVNEIYAPTNRQVFLQLTAQDSINAFWVPALGTVLYAMPQMNAKLHLLSEEDGVFRGLSANYSGDGFAGMRFKWHSVPQEEFNNWVAKARGSGKMLDGAAYLQLTEKSKSNPVEYFSQVDNRLYYRVVNRCVEEGKTCNEDLMKRAAAETLWGQLCSVFDPNEQQVY